MRAGTQEEVAAVAEAQVLHGLNVTLQDPQRLSRVQRVPEVDGVVCATGREYLAVAPPRQCLKPACRPAWVFERRQLLAVAQVAELNREVADDGQPAAVRMEMNAFHRQ